MYKIDYVRIITKHFVLSRKVKKENDGDSGIGSTKEKLRGKVGKGRIIGAVNEEDPYEKGMTKEQKMAYRAGKRNEGG